MPYPKWIEGHYVPRSLLLGAEYAELLFIAIPLQQVRVYRLQRNGSDRSKRSTFHLKGQSNCFYGWIDSLKRRERQEERGPSLSPNRSLLSEF